MIEDHFGEHFFLKLVLCENQNNKKEGYCEHCEKKKMVPQTCVFHRVNQCTYRFMVTIQRCFSKNASLMPKKKEKFFFFFYGAV